MIIDLPQAIQIHTLVIELQSLENSLNFHRHDLIQRTESYFKQTVFPAFRKQVHDPNDFVINDLPCPPQFLLYLIRQIKLIFRFGGYGRLGLWTGLFAVQHLA